MNWAPAGKNFTQGTPSNYNEFSPKLRVSDKEKEHEQQIRRESKKLSRSCEKNIAYS